DRAADEHDLQQIEALDRALVVEPLHGYFQPLVDDPLRRNTGLAQTFGLGKGLDVIPFQQGVHQRLHGFHIHAAPVSASPLPAARVVRRTYSERAGGWDGPEISWRK